jgi:hypothetical protein
VAVVLGLAAGRADQLFSLGSIAGHVRLLVAIPLFFLCETLVDPRMRSFVGTLVGSGLATGAVRQRLESAVADTVRAKDSWLPDAVCLGVVVLSARYGSTGVPHNSTSTFIPGGEAGPIPAIGWWYWFVCLPLVRFLLLRWLWRLVQWTYFLWRVSRLDLALVPTHPDGAAGLGYLEVTQGHFMPLAVGLAALQSASFAEDIHAGTTQFEAIFPGVAVTLGIVLVLFIGPALLFLPKLWACRVQGLSDYMEFAASYVGSFDRKWLRHPAPPDEPLLGTADLQSLADLGNSVQRVRDMWVVPVSLRLVVGFAVATLAPMLPLLLLKYPIAELTRRVLGKLLGG